MIRQVPTAEFFDNRRAKLIASCSNLTFGYFMPTKKTFSLYLAKAPLAALEDLLTEGAKDMIAQGRAKRIASDDFDDESALFGVTTRKCSECTAPGANQEHGR
jgi:hypothetical protein